MKDTVPILTNSYERTVQLVTSHFREMRQPFVRIEAERLFGKKVCLRYGDGQKSGFLVFGRRVNLDRVKSVWYRRPIVSVAPADLPQEYSGFVVNEYQSFLWSLCTTLDAFWMNPPLSVRLLEHNKFRQMIDAAEAGFRVPATIITNSPQELISFCRRHRNKVVMKTLHPTRLANEAGEHELVYTNLISLEQIKSSREQIKLSPVLVQEYIEKELEFRVTIVGDQIFACAIHSQDSEMTKHDWRRYDIENVRHEPYNLSAEIKEKLLMLMAKWRLSYGAIDMILTPEGEYVFLEVNPTGQWGWIEALTGMPISRTIAEILANPPSQ